MCKLNGGSLTGKLVAVFLVVLWCVVPGSLHAKILGHITLKDGSLLYGEIIEMKDGVLRAKAASSTSDPVSFKWEEVTGLTTEGAIAVVLDNGETVEGIAKTVNAGSLQLSSEKSEGSDLDTAYLGKGHLYIPRRASQPIRIAVKLS